MTFTPPTQPELVEIIREYLAGNRLMTMATCSTDAVPWASTVLFAFDETFNFYFLSEHTTRHARNILETGRVAVAINQSKIESGKVQGAQFEGACQAVPEGEELAGAYTVLAERHRWVRVYLQDQGSPGTAGAPWSCPTKYPKDNANHIFKITPEKILYIDDTRFPKAMRAELIREAS